MNPVDPLPSLATQRPLVARVTPTSLDPYGQLIKMLLPRALCVAIYDRVGLPLWLSDGCDGPDLHDVVAETLAAAGDNSTEASDGVSLSWDGAVAYVFLLRNDSRQVIGAAALSCREPPVGEQRPFSLIHGLLRPVLEILSRELANQDNILDLQEHLSVRDQDLELLLGTTGSAQEPDADDFGQLVQQCVTHLGCSLGALLIPDRSIAVCRTSADEQPGKGAEVLTRAHRPLLTWSQLHRRTMLLNSADEASALAKVPYRILSCPVWQGAQRVAGILVLFKAATAPEFDLRQVRIVELLARRIAYVLQNSYDLATGMLTRPAFEKRALSALKASDSHVAHSVIYIDIDRLHVLNENHGMHVGDEVIARLADTIRRSMAPRMLAARISGDRFAVFISDCSLNAASQLAETLRDSIQRLGHVVDAKPIDVSASFGVASVTPAKNPLAHALAAAEIACKAAKDRGRGRVEVYEEADKSIIRRYEDVMLVGALREALANNRFRLEAQPLIALARGFSGQRFELLLRMIDPTGESIAPSKFLSAAERYQLAPDIDRWVVQYVLETLGPHAQRLNAMGAHFAINISGQSIGDEEFLAFLERQLRTHALPPSLISFELTETAAVTNIVRAEAMMHRLRDLGHEIALDDFGRGLSSLTYLKTLPVSYLKIDGDLVRDLASSSRSQAMVSAIVQLATAMGLGTTAECIESEGIRTVVASLGVQFGQGYALGRPQPLDQVLCKLLEESGAPAFSGRVTPSLAVASFG
jgi:diguanylate cyclase (GGDEF)-like protein